jgi:HEPN domain-containing protein
MSEADRAGAVWWLRIALGDLRAAGTISADPDVPPRAAATLFQQAAEKAIKAALARAGLDPPRIHDLTALARLLPASVPDLPGLLELAHARDASESARYPEPGEPEYDPATMALLRDVAERTVRAVSGLLRADGVEVDGLGPV